MLGWTYRGGSTVIDPGVISVSLPRLTGLVAGGSGPITYSGTADALTATVEASGSIALTGNAASAELSVRGSGAIDAVGFRAESGSASVRGSGGVQATFTQRVRATIEGSGSIDLFGGASVTESDNGSGEITVHRALERWTGRTPSDDEAERR